MLPESKTPGVSDEEVCVIESLFVQVTVVPLVIVSGFGAYAPEPRVLAPETIDTAVPAIPPDPVVGADGEELPHPVKNPTSTRPTLKRRIITTSNG